MIANETADGAPFEFRQRQDYLTLVNSLLTALKAIIRGKPAPGLTLLSSEFAKGNHIGMIPARK